MPGLSFWSAARHSIDLLPLRAREAVAIFGWLDTDVHAAVTWAWLGTTVLVVVMAMAVGSWRERVVLPGAVVAAVAMPVVIEGFQAKSVDFYWQGRYSLPFMAGVALMATCVIAGAARERHRLWTVSAGIAGLVALLQGYAWA